MFILLFEHLICMCLFTLVRVRVKERETQVTMSTIGKQFHHQQHHRNWEKKAPFIGGHGGRRWIAAIFTVTEAWFYIHIIHPLDNVTVMLIAGSFTRWPEKCTFTYHTPHSVDFLASLTTHCCLELFISIVGVSWWLKIQVTHQSLLIGFKCHQYSRRWFTLT